jgi:hypothetical protein
LRHGVTLRGNNLIVVPAKAGTDTPKNFKWKMEQRPEQ